MKEQKYSYNDFDITFIIDGEVYINATEMCKAFGKKPKDWLRLPATKDYIAALLKERNSHLKTYELIIVKRGRPLAGGGTLLHESLAIILARWLKPEFAIWCDKRMEELRKYGITAMSGVIDKMIADPEYGIRLLTELKAEREAKLLAENNVRIENQARLLAEKNVQIEHEARLVVEDRLQKFIIYIKSIMDTDGLMSLSDMAKVIGVRCGISKFMGSVLFCRDLRARGILFKRTPKSKNEPVQKYIDNGWFVMKPILKTIKGKKVVFLQAMGTQKGLIGLFNEYNFKQTP